MWKRKEKPLCIFLIPLLLFSIATVVVVVTATPDSTSIKVDPKTISRDVGETFVIDVIVNVTDPPGLGTGLWGFEYKLKWDDSILNVTAIQYHVPTGWKSPFEVANATLDLDSDGVADGHSLSVTTLTGAAYTGVMSLCTYNFIVTGLGSCALDLYEDILVDDTAAEILHTTDDGYFNNLPPAKLYVDPPSIVNTDLVPCENFTINVSISNVINLYAWEFKLYYKSDILNGTSVTEGPFLSGSGSTSFVIIEFNDAFNATHGLVWVNCTLLAPPPVSGNGTLATVAFHVEGLGESMLDLADPALSDPWGGTIPLYVVDGYFNNVLKAHLYVDPPSIIDPTLLPPANFTINIKVANVTDLYDYQFKLGYDTTVLNCLGIIIIPFENETNFTTEIHVDDQAGLVWVNVTYYPPATPLTTTQPKTLAIIFFQVAAMGSTVLDLYDTRLSDTLNGDIPHDVSDGLVSIVERDVAVIDVVTSTNMIYEGREVYINVTVANEGDMVESFNVHTYYDNTLIATLPVVGLAPDTNTTLMFTWNTAGVTPCINYTIKAEADLVPYEMDTADNVYIDGKVKIKMLGDLNGDGTINIVDVVLASLAFGSAEKDNPSTPWDETRKWNPDADLNDDGIVNIIDLVMIAIDFGKTC